LVVGVAIASLSLYRYWRCDEFQKRFCVQKRFPGKGLGNIAKYAPYNFPIGKFPFPDNSSGMNNPHCLIDFHGFQNSGHCLIRFRMEAGYAE
jgi:hypothetical protein